MAVIDALWSGLYEVAAGATRFVDAGLNEHRIRLAVTGLSRSGKTVFITSLIQNLIALGNGRDTLPRLARRLSHGGANRLRQVRVLPTGVETLPHFDFRAHLAGLAAAQPHWPERTQNLAEISLELEIEHESGLRQRLGSRRVRLDILDYPGEWLLDMPLLGLSFSDWSAATIRSLAVAPRQQHAVAFLDFLHGIASDDPADEATLRRGHTLYRAAIEACRGQSGLHYLQPGRFLCPGPQGDAPFMWFFPLPGSSEPLAAGSAGALLRDRFETYKRQIRADFFETHFTRFNRQIVLVDVLGALHAGQVAFEDTAHAILDLVTGLGGGRGYRDLPLIGSTLAAILGPGGIERVAFVATKADHVPELSRTNLQNLLQSLAKPAAGAWEGSPVSYHVAAAIRSTKDGSAMIGGRTVEVVEGAVLGEAKVRPFHVGQVPSAVPPASFWTGQYFTMPIFRPPIIEASGAAGIRHLGMDEVLDAVIGDLL